MSEDTIFYRTKVRGAEFNVFVHQYPYFFSLLILYFVSGDLLMFFCFVMGSIFSEKVLGIFFVIFLIVCPVAIIIFMLSFMAREIMITKDGILIKTWIGRKEIRREDITEIKPLSEKEAYESHHGISAINLTLTASNAVRIVRKKGRDYVFSPFNRNVFLDEVDKAWHE